MGQVLYQVYGGEDVVVTRYAGSGQVFGEIDTFLYYKTWNLFNVKT